MLQDDSAVIHRIINLYALAVDARRWNMFDEVFIEDAIFESTNNRNQVTAQAIKCLNRYGKAILLGFSAGRQSTIALADLILVRGSIQGYGAYTSTPAEWPEAWADFSKLADNASQAYLQVEYDSLGVPFTKRGKTLDEQIWTSLASLKADFAAYHAAFDFTQHVMNNFLVDVDGETAESVTYGQWRLVRYATPGGQFWEGQGWYDDIWIRTSSGWRIRHRVSNVAWWNGNPTVRASKFLGSGTSWPRSSDTVISKWRMRRCPI